MTQKITPFLWFDDNDPEKTKRAMQAMLRMVKIDIQKLQEAYAQQ